MKAVIQRVLQRAFVRVDNQETGSIEKGLVILLGIHSDDTIEDIKWLCNKIIGLRIFNDNNNVMNLSVSDMEGSLLIISQFTLYASTKKGNRPSYINAAKPERAKVIYDQFINHIKSNYEIEVQEGVFGGDMKVSLVNDGPVTIIIDTKTKE
ncbi:D-aminoacyl-tRNA deacylase [Saprospiraceae bacterium]|nr:D-aminoacyl-tRNA deacylase [Saprospiraceae bacterium]